MTRPDDIHRRRPGRLILRLFEQYATLFDALIPAYTVGDYILVAYIRPFR